MTTGRSAASSNQRNDRTPITRPVSRLSRSWSRWSLTVRARKPCIQSSRSPAAQLPAAPPVAVSTAMPRVNPSAGCVVSASKPRAVGSSATAAAVERASVAAAVHLASVVMWGNLRVPGGVRKIFFQWRSTPDDADQGVVDLRVDLPAPELPDDSEDLGRGHLHLVRAVRRAGVPGVGRVDDPGDLRDRLADEAIGVSGSV